MSGHLVPRQPIASVAEYRSLGGGEALTTAHRIGPDEVIATVLIEVGDSLNLLRHPSPTCGCRTANRGKLASSGIVQVGARLEANQVLQTVPVQIG